MQRAIRTPAERSAAISGRLWIARLQRNQRVSSAVERVRRPNPGIRSLSTRGPAIVSSAGSRVSAAIIVIRTANAVAIATP